MIKIKIVSSVIYSVQTLIKEARFITAVCWPYVTIILILSYLDRYIFQWSSNLLDPAIHAWVCQNIVLETFACRFIDSSFLTNLCYNLVTAVMYVALFRYFILGEKDNLIKLTFPWKRLHHTKNINLGYCYFRFQTQELFYFVLAAFTGLLTVIGFSITKYYLFSAASENIPLYGDNEYTWIYKLFENYGFIFIETFVYTLLALVYAHLSVNGVPDGTKLIQLITKLRGNFVRALIIIFILFLPYDIISQYIAYLPFYGRGYHLLNIFYHTIHMLSFDICMFASIIFISRLYRKFYEPEINCF